MLFELTWIAVPYVLYACNEKDRSQVNYCWQKFANMTHKQRVNERSYKNLTPREIAVVRRAFLLASHGFHMQLARLGQQSILFLFGRGPTRFGHISLHQHCRLCVSEKTMFDFVELSAVKYVLEKAHEKSHLASSRPRLLGFVPPGSRIQ